MIVDVRKKDNVRSHELTLHCLPGKGFIVKKVTDIEIISSLSAYISGKENRKDVINDFESGFYKDLF